MAQKDLSKIIRKSMSQSRFHNSSMSNLRKSMSQSRFHNSSMSNLQNSSTIKSSYD